VAKAAYDPTTRKWLLEGAVRSPARTLTDLKQQPPVTPWNLGVFDGLMLADKMTGCTGEVAHGATCVFCGFYKVRCTYVVVGL
jgi:hypothetical protein